MIDEPFVFLDFDILNSLFGTLWLVLSLIASVDILLRKSDPRSSLLWLALVWLSPLLGVFIYFMFGINRIANRARQLNFSDALAIDGYTSSKNGERSAWESFVSLGDEIAGSPLVSGNNVEVLSGNTDIHNAMMDAVNEAQDSIAISTYIFRRDRIGLALADELLAAKNRGVDVRVLLDGFGNSIYRTGIFRYFRKYRLLPKRFLHSVWPWRMPLLNLRNHRKILIIDGRTTFTGSVNIGDVKNQETHFKITGPIAGNVLELFEIDWAETSDTDPIDRSEITIDSFGDSAIRLVASGPNLKRENLRWIILGAMGAAQKKIRIVTPYFVPDQGLIAGILLARYRGIDVEIVLPKKSNYFFVDWASRRQIKDLTSAGCKIYLQDGPFDHSKLMTIDGEWSLFGSSNWDARSMRLNFEMDLECHDPVFCQKLDIVIDHKLRNSTRLAQYYYKDRSIFLRLRDSIARLALPYL